MKVGHFFSSSNPFAFRFRMARRIKHVRSILDKVAADGNKFGLERIDVDHRPVQRREMTYSHVDASSVIGRENDKEEIVKLLMQPHPDGNGDKGLFVIPIVGIGGLGKTTLAKLVFNDKRMVELFQLKMWVCVSDDFDIRHIIIKIINAPSTSDPTVALAYQENINNLEMEQLLYRLRCKLSGQKFLLVLDDIWNDDRAKWIELKDLIEDRPVGSKVLVTTRSNSIASMMGTVPSHVLGGLSAEDCQSLFVKWAFKEGEEKKYPNLVEIGKEIVKKCQGVPLAVKTLGGSLFSTFDLDKWESVRDNETWNLKQKRDDILPALKLSYDQMPSHLRHCFATFSLYPKDFGFSTLDMISLWVALGLLQSPVGSQKQENIGKQYLDELQSRLFLQDFHGFGQMYIFKVHDLVHDLALYVAKEEFLVVNSHTQNIPEHVRHLSIVESDSLGHALFPKSRTVRTIFFPIKGVGLDSQTLLDTWVSRYKYLRVLGLTDSSFETLPGSIVKLEHLRVLDLSFNRKIKRIPHCICKLLNLHVFSIRGCTELETLPKGLGKLINLRNLYITTKQYVLSQDEFESLSNLQDLSFEWCDNLKFLFEWAQLTSLQQLNVSSCRNLECLPPDILPGLELLSVADCEMLNLSLQHETPMTDNDRPKLSRWKMKTLLLEDFPEVRLPQWIDEAADTLQSLMITNFPNLEMLPECLSRMTHLNELYILNCPRLVLPHSPMHRLTTFEDLRFEPSCIIL